MLEAFELVAIERIPAICGGRATATLGTVEITRDEIDVGRARNRKSRLEAARWSEMLSQASTPSEDQ